MPEVALKLSYRFQGAELTQRELEVLRLMVTGRSNREISASLCIVEATVKYHVKNILEKLGVSDRLQAVTTCETRLSPSLEHLLESIGIPLNSGIARSYSCVQVKIILRNSDRKLFTS